MTYIVNESCIKCKYMDCVEVCPVDCFYEGENMLVIHPDDARLLGRGDGGGGAHAETFSSRQAGNRTVNRVPSPGHDSTWMVPLWSRTMP